MRSFTNRNTVRKVVTPVERCAWEEERAAKPKRCRFAGHRIDTANRHVGQVGTLVEALPVLSRILQSKFIQKPGGQRCSQLTNRRVRAIMVPSVRASTPGRHIKVAILKVGATKIVTYC